MDVQRQKPADDIPAHIIGRGRDDVKQPLKVQPHFMPPQKAGGRGNGGEGRGEYRPRIQSQKKMDHGGIAGQDHNRAAARVDPCAVRQLLQKHAEGLHSCVLQMRQVSRRFHGIGDPGEDIGAVGGLAVYGSFFTDDRTGIQVDQLHDHGGGAVVHRKAVMAGGGIACFHIRDHPVVFPVDQRDGDIESCVPAKGIEPAQYLQREGDRFIAEGIQRQPDPPVIADGYLLRGHFQG